MCISVYFFFDMYEKMYMYVLYDVYMMFFLYNFYMKIVFNLYKIFM